MRGLKRKSVRVVDSVDLRYRGQSYELTVPFTRGFVSNFHKMHERRYGHSDAARPVEIVNVRSDIFRTRTQDPIPENEKDAVESEGSGDRERLVRG